MEVGLAALRIKLRLPSMPFQSLNGSSFKRLQVADTYGVWVLVYFDVDAI
jgi:hypothetical protein